MKNPGPNRENGPHYPTREEVTVLVKAGLIAVAVGSLSACSEPKYLETRPGGVVVNTLPVSGPADKKTVGKDLPAAPREKRTEDQEAPLPRTCFPGVSIQQVDMDQQ